MGMTYQISHKQLTCAIAVFVLLLIMVWYIPVLKSKAQLAKAISRVHYTTKALETYVDDIGTFPTNLEALGKEYGISPEALVLTNYGKWFYFCPNTNTPDDAPVILVTYNGSAIFVDKKFTRRVVSAYYKEMNR
jgi:hypothetical protein